MPATTAKGAATRARIVETAADLDPRPRRRRHLAGRHPVGHRHEQEPAVPLLPGRQGRARRGDRRAPARAGARRAAPLPGRARHVRGVGAWRAAVLRALRRQEHLACPIGALTLEAASTSGRHMERWRGYFDAGVAGWSSAGSSRATPSARAGGLRRPAGRLAADEGRAVARAARGRARRRAGHPAQQHHLPREAAGLGEAQRVGRLGRAGSAPRSAARSRRRAAARTPV